MKDVRVHIIGMGIVTPLGKGCRSNRDALLEGRIGIGPLNLFPTASGSPLPVGEVSDPAGRDGLPRTHRLALAAAEQAMDHVKTPPDAVVMGVTTGGLLATEGLLKENVSDPDRYRRHGAGSVAAVDEEVQRLLARRD